VSVVEGRKLTAYHEAGHATVARLLGAEVYHLDLESKCDEDGDAQFGEVRYRIGPYREFQEVQIAMARLPGGEQGPGRAPTGHRMRPGRRSRAFPRSSTG
jgi:hypothetical protein